MRWIDRHRRAVIVVLVIAAAATPVWARQQDIVGFVDGSAFIDCAGEDAISVEVSLKGPLLKALTSFDPEISAMVGGLESIHAVILDLSEMGDSRAAANECLTGLINRTRSRLRKGGWDTIATVRERDAEIRVLVLNDEEVIRGLTVMVVDDEEVVFTNVAGIIDLAALERLGESLDIPGLEDLD